MTRMIKIGGMWIQPSAVQHVFKSGSSTTALLAGPAYLDFGRDVSVRDVVDAINAEVVSAQQASRATVVVQR